MSNGCDVNTDVGVYPLASPLPVECEVLPSIGGKYIKRSYIVEQPTVTLEDFTPIKSQTPTPTVTPTISLTPSITPTNTSTPQPTFTATPTLTPTVTPTITPTSSQLPSVRFEMDFTISIYTEVQIVFSTVDSTIYIYHATEGPFPLNPVNIKWRSYYNNNIVSQGSGETDWTIPWKYIMSPQKRFLLGDISASAVVAVASIPGIIVGGALVLVSAGLVSGSATYSFLSSIGLSSLAGVSAGVSGAVSGFLGGGAVGAIGGTIAGVVAVLGVVAVVGVAIYQIGKWLGLWGKKKQPPPPKPYPQWSPKYQISAIIPKTPKSVRLYKGTIPDTVEEGDIYIEWGPSAATAGLMSIVLRDSSKNASTLEPWEFGLVIES